MNNINVTGTDFTPRIEFDAKNRTLEIEGKIFETHKIQGQDIFSMLTTWLNQYFDNKGESVTIKLRLSYFDTPSSKKMFRFFRVADDMHKKGHHIAIIWEYEDGDEDAMMDGEVYKKNFGLPFDITKF